MLTKLIVPSSGFQNCKNEAKREGGGLIMKGRELEKVS
jgi:hypothetical protein